MRASRSATRGRRASASRYVHERHDPRRAQAARDEREQLERRAVGRVQIVEHEQQRVLARAVRGRRRSRSRTARSARAPDPRACPPRSVALAGDSSSTRTRSGTSSAVRASGPSSSIHGQYAGAPPVSQARPQLVTNPCAVARATTSSASRVLPMPGSPLRTRSTPRPPVAASRLRSRASISRPLPTNIRGQ